MGNPSHEKKQGDCPKALMAKGILMRLFPFIRSNTVLFLNQFQPRGKNVLLLFFP